MRVLMITQVYPPEMGALANRMYPIARQLVARGHDVFVATGMPNYPQGLVFPAYRGKRAVTEVVDGAVVHRTAYYTAPRNRSAKRQLRSYLSFLPAVLRSGLRAGPIDVVFVTSPPIFPVLPAMWLARLRRARLVLDLRDLWPDEIVACGAAEEGSAAIRAIRAIERRAYRAADCVACTTEAFIDTVAGRGVPRSKSLLVPNGADLSLFRPLPPDNSVAAAHGFRDRFVALYSGLMGIKHGLETILTAASALREERQIVFAMVGSGPREESLREQARAMALDNVMFLGEQPLHDLPHLLARADVCLSTLQPAPYLDKIISAKVFEYLACAKPVVMAQSGESARVIEKAGAGLVVPPGDGEALASAVLRLYRSPETRATMGAAGLEYVTRHHSRDRIAERLEARLAELCSPARRPVLQPELADALAYVEGSDT